MRKQGRDQERRKMTIKNKKALYFTVPKNWGEFKRRILEAGNKYDDHEIEGHDRNLFIKIEDTATGEKIFSCCLIKK